MAGELGESFARVGGIGSESGVSFLDAHMKQPPLTPPKIFATPFRLAFKRGQDVVWIEVKSLGGLKSVIEKLEQGEFEEIERSSSLEMQLWGHLAEHIGFLRPSPTTTFMTGIQPLGEKSVALAEDLTELLGGNEAAALQVLAGMRQTMRQKPIDNTPIQPGERDTSYVKDDGVNLTREGEDLLRHLTGISKAAEKPPRPETVEFERDSENALALLAATPPGPPEPEEPVEPSVEIKTGEEAAKIGRAVEAARPLEPADEDEKAEGAEAP